MVQTNPDGQTHTHTNKHTPTHKHVNILKFRCSNFVLLTASWLDKKDAKHCKLITLLMFIRPACKFLHNYIKKKKQEAGN